jgi:hypothetical protein
VTQAPSDDRAVGADQANPAHTDEHANSDRDSSGPPRTGDPAVDAALVTAAAVQGANPADQLETYVGTHRALQDRLADSGA